MSAATVRNSKRLSWLLRHGAQEQSLAMDEAGWADVDDVRRALHLSRAELADAVANNDKGRLQLDGTRIRACQGHSHATMPVTLDALEASWRVLTPTASLWHGTRLRAMPSIADHGLVAGERTHVHLAATRDSRVGKRAAVEVLVEVDPSRLRDLGVTVFVAPNGVVLARVVPAAAIVAVHATTDDGAARLASLAARSLTLVPWLSRD